MVAIGFSLPGLRYVGGSLATLLVTQAPLSLLRNAGIIRAASIPDSILTSVAYSACLVIQLAGAICAWRCARNTARKVWRYLAWAAIIVLTVLPLLRLAYVMQSYWPQLSGAIDCVAVDVTRKEPPPIREGGLQIAAQCSTSAAVRPHPSLPPACARGRSALHRRSLPARRRRTLRSTAPTRPTRRHPRHPRGCVVRTIAVE